MNLPPLRFKEEKDEGWRKLIWTAAALLSTAWLIFVWKYLVISTADQWILVLTCLLTAPFWFILIKNALREEITVINKIFGAILLVVYCGVVAYQLITRDHHNHLVYLIGMSFYYGLPFVWGVQINRFF